MCVHVYNLCVCTTVCIIRVCIIHVCAYEMCEYICVYYVCMICKIRQASKMLLHWTIFCLCEYV